MPTTPTYALPYPAPSDPADVPLDMRELAERVEVVIPEQLAQYAEIATPEAGTSSTTPADLDTGPGPSITIARAGFYIVHAHAVVYVGNAGAAPQLYVKVGTAAAVSIGETYCPLAYFFRVSGGPYRINAAAGEVVKLQYSVNGGASAWQQRRMSLVRAS